MLAIVPEVEVKQRPEAGTSAVRAVRERGQVPAVLYGHKQDNVNLSLDSFQFENVLKTKPILVKLNIEGKPQHAIIKDVSYNYVGPHLTHVDFQRVSLDEVVRINAPLEFFGTPRGAEKGGRIDVVRPSVAITTRVDRIPQKIVVDVSGLDLHESLRCADIKLPEGATLVSHPGSFICRCEIPRRAKVVTVEAVAAAVAEGEAAAAATAEGGEAAAGAAAAGAKGGEAAAPAKGEAAPAKGGKK